MAPSWYRRGTDKWCPSIMGLHQKPSAAEDHRQVVRRPGHDRDRRVNLEVFTVVRDQRDRETVEPPEQRAETGGYLQADSARQA